MTTIYEGLSTDRKLGQEQGDVPPFMSTASYQIFVSKYAEQGQTVRDRYIGVAKAAGDIATELYGDQDWEQRFFTAMWNGWLSPSTPLLSNLGTNRGLPVACSGGYIDDSIYGFYSAQLEAAMLTKNGFGTSSYMGDIRPRGSAISVGGKATGSVPVFKDFAQIMVDVSQAGIRRGSWAGYIEADHGDFDELADELFNHPDGLNIGWIISDAFIDRLNSGDQDTIRRYQKIMRIRKITGKGYMFFVDKVNRQNPQMYKDMGLEVKASQLCTEIALFSDQDHTYTCVLSSLNLAKWDEWKDTDLVELSTVFLDVVAESFIRQAKDMPGLEKAVRFTEKSRALGLGVMGFHTLLQQKRITFDSMEAHMLNNVIFSTINKRSLKSSQEMAKLAGEPEWCKGYGVRNTHRIAVAPTMSTALIMGGVSQGIEPIVANVFNQNSSAGEIFRINPTLLEIMKERGVYNDKEINKMAVEKGSVATVDWLDDHEKEVFKTAYEINQKAVVRLASARQKHIDQAQSLNLFFDSNADPKWISEIHREAMLDPNIKSLYYMRSTAGIRASTGECSVCEG